MPFLPSHPAQAVGANELQLTDSTLVLNTASDTGGALDAAACALVVINASRVDNNTAPSGGGAHLWNANDAYGTAYGKGQPVGGSIAIVAKSTFNNNAAVRTLVPADETTGQEAVLTVRQQGGLLGCGALLQRCAVRCRPCRRRRGTRAGSGQASMPRNSLGVAVGRNLMRCADTARLDVGIMPALQLSSS